MQQHWTADALIDHWTLLPADRELLANKTGSTRLGFAVMLKAFAFEGRFPGSLHDIPTQLVAYVAQQVNVAPELYSQYDWRGRSSTNHRAQIRNYYHFREATAADPTMIAGWPGTQVLNTEQRSETLRVHVLVHLRELRIEPLKPKQIEHLVQNCLIFINTLMI
jgi:hypothetical protein